MAIQSILTPEEQQRGLQGQTKKSGGFVQSLAKPFLKGTASALNTLEGAGTLLGSLPGGISQEEMQRIGEATTKERSFGPLGTARPVGVNQDTGEMLSTGRGIADIVGTGLEIGSYAAPASVGANVVKGVGKATLGQAVKGLGIGGVVAGTGAGVGAELQNQDATIGSVIGSGLVGGTIGGVTGAGLAGAGRLGVNAFKKAAPLVRAGGDAVQEAGAKFGIGTSKLPIEEQVRNATSVYDNILGGSKKQITLIDDFQQKTGENLSEYLVKNGVVLNTNDAGTKFLTKEIAESSKKEVMDTLEDSLQSILKPWKDSKLVNLVDIGNAVSRDIAQDTSIDALTVLQRQKVAKDFIEAEMQRAGGSLIDLPTANQIKRNYWKLGFEMLSPQKKPTAQAIGRGLMNRIEEVVADPIVTNLNKEMRKSIMASNFLEKISGDAVKGGRLGRGATRLIGTVAGIKMGPVGALASGEILTRLVSRFGSVERISAKVIRELMDSGSLPSHIKTVEEARIFLANLMEQRAGTKLLGQGPVLASQGDDASRQFTQQEATQRLQDLGTLPTESNRVTRAIQNAPRLQ